MTTTTIESSGEGEQPPSHDGEASRTSADLSVGDQRWMSVTGLAELIPALVLESFLEARLSPDGHTVSVALLSDAEVRSLNKAFRGKDAPTNVLSFPAAPVPRSPRRPDEAVFLGDIALAYETVHEEALAQDKPVLHHAAHLIVHGVLHLSGFDHGDDAGAGRMEAAERSILARLGIPDPYRDDALPLETAL